MFALETPSRVLARVKALEQQGNDLEELPSLPNVDSSQDSVSFDYAQINPRDRFLSPGVTPSIKTPSTGKTVRPATNKQPVIVRPDEQPQHSKKKAGLYSSQRSASGRPPSPIQELTEPLDASLSLGEGSSSSNSSDAVEHPFVNAGRRRISSRDRVPSLTYSAASSQLSSVPTQPSPQLPQHHQLSIVQDDDQESSFQHNDLDSPAKDKLNSFVYSSPGIGRDMHAGTDSSRFPGQTPLSTNIVNMLPSTATTNPSRSPFATPKPQQSDIERRKSHLLATLQLTAIRSEARARIKKGTPFPPKRSLSARQTSKTDASSSDEHSVGHGYSSAGNDGPSDATSNDLNPMPANSSLPLDNAKATRFNGAKLNAYLHTLNTHLTTENQNLVTQLEERDEEIDQLRRMAGIASAAESGHDDKSRGEISAMLSSEIHREVDRLQAHLDEREAEVEKLREVILNMERQHAEERSDETRAMEQVDQIVLLQKQVFALKDELTDVKEDHVKELADWRSRADELLLTLGQKDKEIDDGRSERDAQEAGFADKMKRLEDELCHVMEEQEAQFEEAKADAERLRQEVEQYQDEIQALTEERKHLVQALEADQSTTHSQDDARVEHTQRNSNVQIVELNAECARLKKSLSARESKLTRSETEMDQLQQEIAALKRQLQSVEIASEDHETAIKRLTGQKEQAEAQLNEMEDDLKEAQHRNAGLQSRLDEYLQDRQTGEVDLRVQLDQAQREIDRLQSNTREQLLSKDAQKDLKDLEIANLTRAKAELETRVASLKKQINLLRMPMEDDLSPDTPERSLPFRSILGVPTPKTPGFYKYNNTYRTGNASDESITSLMQQLEALERQVRQLQRQLEDANEELDDKISKLQIADHEHLNSNKRLAAANARIAQLESKSGGVARPNADFVRLEDELDSAKRQIRALLSKGRDEKTQLELRSLRKEKDQLADNLKGMYQDLHRVKKDALDLGVDIDQAKNGSHLPPVGKSLSSVEAKTLLATVGHLKAKFTRESRFRYDLAHQKQYLESQNRIQKLELHTTQRILSKYGLSYDKPMASRSKRTLRSLALSVVATIRMRRATDEWNKQLATKAALRQAYSVTRGKPFPY